MVPSQSMQYIQYQQSKASFSDVDTIVETPFSLTVNGKNWLTFMCTPISLEEMATGFLFNEGVIDKWEEVSEVRVCERGDNVDIWLNHEAQPPTSWQ
jgi:FdhD protein